MQNFFDFVNFFYFRDKNNNYQVFIFAIIHFFKHFFPIILYILTFSFFKDLKDFVFVFFYNYQNYKFKSQLNWNLEIL